MNCDLMKQYIEFVADRLMMELGFNKVRICVNVNMWIFVGNSFRFAGDVVHLHTYGISQLLDPESLK